MVQTILAQGQELDFNVTGTDGDGDPASGTVHVEVTVDPVPGAQMQTFSFVQDSVPEEDSAPAEDSAPVTPLQTATEEADTLLATDDADNFVWSLADHTAQGDSIVGFNTEADAINIADILADTVDTTDFSSYLNVSLEGASTVLRISNTGDFEHADQVITVQDVNLFEGVDFSDTAALTTALQNMVDAGKLITD